MGKSLPLSIIYIIVTFLRKGLLLFYGARSGITNSMAIALLMDLHSLQSYLRPHRFSELQRQQVTTDHWRMQSYSWLAGGTWLYSQPQPQIRTLIDLERLNWSEIEITSEGVTLGATCTLASLLRYPWPSHWLAISALQAAIQSLASFKVTEVATVGGNLCLALTVGSLAPVMLALSARYELWELSGAQRWVAAHDFQVGPQLTLLRSGEVLRRVHIPVDRLQRPAYFERFSSAEVEPALAIVVASVGENSSYSFSLNGAVSAPLQLRFPGRPHPAQICEALSPLSVWIADHRSSADYRRHLTALLMQRCLSHLP